MEMKKVQKQSALYPERLRQQPFMPEELFYYGNLPDDALPTVGIIGARVCSAYGEAQAYRFAEFLSNHGVQVISGLARGIDGAAHKGALAGVTPTYGILGCGVDICYPKSNQSLYEKMKRKGGVISEYEPGTPPSAWHFPLRNRIISALSDIILVVEARVKSGTQITVEHALEQGKTVYAVPGRIQDQLSRGCHMLIEQGAGIAYSPEILLKELQIEYQKQDCRYMPVTESESIHQLPPELKKIYRCLDQTPKNLDQLQRETGFILTDLLEGIVHLEMSGMIKEYGFQHYVRL